MDNENNKIYVARAISFLIGCAIGAAIGLIMISLSGCNAPQRKDFEIQSCFNASDCGYRIKENTLCDSYMALCQFITKDKYQKIAREKELKFCLDNWKVYNFEGQRNCRTWFNQK